MVVLLLRRLHSFALLTFIPLAKRPVVLVRVSAPFSFYFLGVLFVSSLCSCVGQLIAT